MDYQVVVGAKQAMMKFLLLFALPVGLMFAILVPLALQPASTPPALVLDLGATEDGGVAGLSVENPFAGPPGCGNLISFVTSMVVGGEGSGYDRKDVVTSSASGHNLPLLVPHEYYFTVVRLQLVNKYPAEEKYSVNYAKMKLQTSAISVSSHDPSQHYEPGIVRYPRLGPSSGAHWFRALIENNQVEEQNVWVVIAGYICR